MEKRAAQSMNAYQETVALAFGLERLFFENCRAGLEEGGAVPLPYWLRFSYARSCGRRVSLLPGGRA